MIGIVITIAEPSVQVLGQQVNQISEGKIGRVLLIGIVSVGTGVFSVCSVTGCLQIILLSIDGDWLCWCISRFIFYK